MIYFKDSEFKCCDDCGKGQKDIQPQALALLLMARHAAGIPFVINSSVRCSQHNIDVGGVDTSSHLTGWAFDIKAVNSEQRYTIAHALMKAGFNRLGIYFTFIHADCDPDKNSKRMWIK